MLVIEACLSSETALWPGRELIKGLRLCDHLDEHPRVPGHCQDGYQQTLKNDELPQQDYYAAFEFSQQKG